jgi:hypothetical protein
MKKRQCMVDPDRHNISQKEESAKASDEEFENQDSFSNTAMDAQNMDELRQLYESFLKRKEEQIEELKKENEILLRTALKKRSGEVEISRRTSSKEGDDGIEKSKESKNKKDQMEQENQRDDF